MEAGLIEGRIKRNSDVKKGQIKIGLKENRGQRKSD